MCKEKILKGFFLIHEIHVRSSREGPTMGRTAEGRSKLVELADDSVPSTDATIPSSPRGARSMTGRRSVPLCLGRGEAVDVGAGMEGSPWNEFDLHSHRR